MDQKRLLSLICTVLFILLAQSGHVNAAIYKCVSASGDTTYSQSPCPKDADSSRYSAVGSGVKKANSMDCRLAQRFAETAAQDMRAGRSSGSVFNRYGGLGSMSGSAVSIVNYVYTFEHNYQTSIERIGGLTRVRCENGSFGDASCEKYPGQFVSDAGGCDLSKISVNGADTQSNYRSENTEDSTGQRVAQRGASQEEYLAEQSRVQCKTKVLKKLEAIDKKTRTGMTPAEHDSYRTERSKLRQQFHNC